VNHHADAYGSDFYTEPGGDWDTLANLGPLRPMAGTWEGSRGADEHPAAAGLEHDSFFERYELQPVDLQTNGPQLFYGLRYHTHIVGTGEVEMFHDQVGYWLWEPADNLVTFALAISRGQVLLASGHAEPDDTQFEVRAAIGSNVYGILSNPFLERAFRTTEFRLNVSIGGDDTWSYEEQTIIEIPGLDQPFAHVDRNTLSRVATPTPNPMAQGPS
jgi:hypothetical protein